MSVFTYGIEVWGEHESRVETPTACDRVMFKHLKRLLGLKKNTPTLLVWWWAKSEWPSDFGAWLRVPSLMRMLHKEPSTPAHRALVQLFELESLGSATWLGPTLKICEDIWPGFQLSLESEPGGQASSQSNYLCARSTSGPLSQQTSDAEGDKDFLNTVIRPSVSEWANRRRLARESQIFAPCAPTSRFHLVRALGPTRAAELRDMIFSAALRARAITALHLLIGNLPIPRVTGNRYLHKVTLAVDRRCWCGILQCYKGDGFAPYGTEEHIIFECPLIEDGRRVAILKPVFETFGPPSNQSAHDLFLRVLREGQWRHVAALAKILQRYTQVCRESAEKVRTRLGRPSHNPTMRRPSSMTDAIYLCPHKRLWASHPCQCPKVEFLNKKFDSPL